MKISTKGRYALRLMLDLALHDQGRPVRLKDVAARLQEKGYFEYGGSTVILLLEHGKFEPAADIAKWSARGIESKVKTGDPVGRRP